MKELQINMEDYIPRTMGEKAYTELKRNLRKQPTKAEAVLWKFLKNKQLNNLRFRRQHGIGPYIADFCHSKSATVIELDGGIHEDPEQKLYDRQREDFLNAKGYSILRFKNQEILKNLSEVLNKIEEHISKQLSTKQKK
jgi:very-short-patch-repair endonuclease